MKYPLNSRKLIHRKNMILSKNMKQQKSNKQNSHTSQQTEITVYLYKTTVLNQAGETEI